MHCAKEDKRGYNVATNICHKTKDQNKTLYLLMSTWHKRFLNEVALGTNNNVWRAVLNAGGWDKADEWTMKAGDDSRQQDQVELILRRLMSTPASCLIHDGRTPAVQLSAARSATSPSINIPSVDSSVTKLTMPAARSRHQRTRLWCISLFCLSKLQHKH